MTAIEHENSQRMIEKLFPNLRVMSDAEAKEHDDMLANVAKKEQLLKKQQAFENSGVGRRYWQMTLDDFCAYNSELEKNLAVVKDFIASVNAKKSKALWFCGANGTGKTMLASMAVRECGGRFVRMYELMSAFHANYRDAMEVIKPLARQKLVVVDEVGCVDENEINVLFPLINEIYENCGSMILIANASKIELGRMLGKSIIDRFTENCTALEFTCDSYRKKNRSVI